MDSVNTSRPTTRTLAVIDSSWMPKTRVHPLPSTGKPKLIDQVRQAIRTRHYSPRTSETYVHWIKRFIFFHNKRHPAEMAEPEIARFLSNLARESRVSGSTQNQALNALLFLYHQVLGKEIGYVNGVVRAKKAPRLPVVLTRGEIQALLGYLNGSEKIMATLLYGAGLRLMECCRLRVKDIDFSQNQIVVRAGKGDKDRYTMLPAAVKELLIKHLDDGKRQHQHDVEKNLGRVVLPNALDRKYPNAGQEWGWQWVFPATRYYVDRETGRQYRHHLHESVLQKAVREAVRNAGIAKPATCHSITPFFRHASAGGWIRYPDGAGIAGAPRCQHDDDLHACFESRRPRCSKPSGPATENLKTRCRLGDRLRANSGIGRHAGSNCQKTWLDFRVASERYSSTSSLASRAELFGIGGQHRRGLNGSLNS